MTMGCNDYVDTSHWSRMERRSSHYRTLDELGYDLVNITMRFSDVQFGRCRICAAVVWLGDLTEVDRLRDAYLHHGWHAALANGANNE